MPSRLCHHNIIRATQHRLQFRHPKPAFLGSSYTRSSLSTSKTHPSNHHDQQLRGYNNLPQIIPTKGVPIHLYADEIEPQAMAQVRLLAESPLPVEFVSVMPDAHLGKGVTIGTVFASETYICPNAVGVDIGCGMAAVPINDLYKHKLSDSQRVQIFERLKERVPTGFAKHRQMLPETRQVLEKITEELQPTDYVKEQLLLPRVTGQLGTLGGGNHFWRLYIVTRMVKFGLCCIREVVTLAIE